MPLTCRRPLSARTSRSCTEHVPAADLPVLFPRLGPCLAKLPNVGRVSASAG